MQKSLHWESSLTLKELLTTHHAMQSELHYRSGKCTRAAKNWIITPVEEKTVCVSNEHAYIAAITKQGLPQKEVCR